MDRPEIIRAVRWDTYALLRWRHLLLITVLFVVIAFWNAYRVTPHGDAWDVVSLTFGGFVRTSVMDGMAWLLIQLLPLYYLGMFANEALTDHSVLLLMRIRSRARWWMAKIVTVLITTQAYFLWGFLVVIGLAHVLRPAVSDPHGLVLWGQESLDRLPPLLWMYMLQAVTATAMATVLLTLSILWMRAHLPFLLVSLTNLVSLAVATRLPRLHPFVPGTQSMLALHEGVATGTPGFTLSWSIAYNAVLWALAFWLGYGLLAVRDIAGRQD
ncbi:MAG: hypothetical protein L6E13_04760 [Firmicutes bacterium]|nr:hypothetical protein [Bacillota bacterium]